MLRRGVNIETTDELRGSVGLGEYEPTEEPGGTIMISSSMVALGDDIFGDEEDDLPPGFPGQEPPVAPVAPVAPVDDDDDDEEESE